MVKDSIKISQTKNVFDGSAETTLTPTPEKGTCFKRNTVDVWKNFRFFKHQACDFSIDKSSMPEITIFYVKQTYQSYKDNKKVYYCDL